MRPGAPRPAAAAAPEVHSDAVRCSFVLFFFLPVVVVRSLVRSPSLTRPVFCQHHVSRQERSAQRSSGCDLEGRVEGDPGVDGGVVRERARLAYRADAGVDAVEGVRGEGHDGPAETVFVVVGATRVAVVVVVVVVVFRAVAFAVVVVVGGGAALGEGVEDGIRAPRSPVLGSHDASGHEDDVGLVRYEQQPQEHEVVVEVALGGREEVRGRGVRRGGRSWPGEGGGASASGRPAGASGRIARTSTVSIAFASRSYTAAPNLDASATNDMNTRAESTAGSRPSPASSASASAVAARLPAVSTRGGISRVPRGAGKGKGAARGLSAARRGVTRPDEENAGSWQPRRGDDTAGAVLK